MSSNLNPFQILHMLRQGIPGPVLHLLHSLIYAAPYLLILIALLQSREGRRHYSCVIGIVLVLLSRLATLIGTILIQLSNGAVRPGFGLATFYQVGLVLYVAGLLTFGIGLFGLLNQVDTLASLGRLEED